MLCELTASVTKKDGPAVGVSAQTILHSTAGNALSDPGEFKAPEGIDLEGIMVRFRVVTEGQRKKWTAAAAMAARAYRDALVAKDTVAMMSADEKIAEVYADCICAVLESIDGVDGLKPDLRDNVEAFRAVGLFSPLYRACDYFLELPPGKALRCGLPRPLTSAA